MSTAVVTDLSAASVSESAEAPDERPRTRWRGWPTGSAIPAVIWEQPTSCGVEPSSSYVETYWLPMLRPPSLPRAATSDRPTRSGSRCARRQRPHPSRRGHHPSGRVAAPPHCPWLRRNQAGSKQSGSTTRGRTTTACRPFHPETKSADRRRAGQTAKPVSEPMQEVQCEAQSLSLGFPLRARSTSAP